MTPRKQALQLWPIALPALVLAGYGAFITMTYWPYLDLHLRLRSPELGGLPEDVIGFGFWMWWPIVAVLFAGSLFMVWLSARNPWTVAAALVGVFALLSAADYLLCQRLIQELLGA